ncbi:ModE family transcriptional regulator [Thiosulfatimonas sediminis]|uniref:ModE family transcriptional regulator n=1 Tax=Thiosulfatimonas sediminis TaxID=2675054 RepID=A0A6F8PSY2_9GAMM|nr:winged helix-turn-helix domain-containing protein [Thiosulfatimonas sediminis]BBP45196.1 ModE family transcriptional regulator [Thiosulfatimonas sediminis]
MTLLADKTAALGASQAAELAEQDKIPGGAYSDWLHARLWIKGKNRSFIGIGRVELLENIARYGSMNQAAKEMGMSYKKAWKLVDELNEIYEQPLVAKAQGGKSGGGSVLTPKGEALVALFRQLEQGLSDHLQQASQQIEAFNQQ